jgi:hypothetical protein
VIGVKVFNGDEIDKVSFPIYLDRALKRKEISVQQYTQLSRMHRAALGRDGKKK